ncbi:MAG TPA: hypothetical protein VET65_14245 [Candidatus Limnocylindrales bacterium]|nr:hypothetical protein [Candidatus Limnocylindrales bacterium]
MLQERTSPAPPTATIRTIPYDLLKELAIALGACLVLVIVLAAALSSPDVPSATIQSWAQADPVDFTTTAANELAGNTTTAGYGAPYTSADAGQTLGPIAPSKWAGVRQPIDTANDFVISPLNHASVGDTDLTSALASFQSGSDSQKTAWLTAYTKALNDAKVENGKVVVASGDYGPVPVLMDRLLTVARSGGLDGLLLTSGHFYQTDFTKPLLFMGDGTYLSGLAQNEHLTGSQWGMMNETGQYPGQTWLWLYTVWYQIPPFNTASNADLLVVGLMGLLTLGLLLVPFIPGLRDIPRWVPIYRLAWRRYYREEAGR